MAQRKKRKTAKKKSPAKRRQRKSKPAKRQYRNILINALVDLLVGTLLLIIGKLLEKWTD